MMERAITEYIVNALWQVPLLAGSAWLLVRVVRPGPRAQHGVWLSVLGLAVLLPMHGMGRVGVLAPQPQVTTVATQERAAIDESSPHYSPRAHTIRLTATAAHWLVRVYVAAVVLALLRIARAWRGARHLVARAQETSQHEAALAHYSQRFGIRLPQIRESAEVSSPMIVGAAAPVLLLPEGFARFTADEVRAALCHELAHVKRRDYLMNLVCQLAALPLAWHPVVDKVQQRIRMTREMVCDAMAAEEMRSHIGYARCLLALAHNMLGERGMGQAQFLGLFSKNTLEERVMRLMETTSMSMRARVGRVASGAVVMIAAGSLATMFHVTPTMAESGAGVPPQATQSAAQQAQPAVTAPQSSPAPAAAKPTHRARAAREKCLDRKTEQQMAKARETLDSPEFELQMEDAQRQMAKAKLMLDSPEFKKQIEDAQRQMTKAMLNSPQFKQQMDEAQRQMSKATAMLNSPEFEQQMEDVQRKISKATAVLDSPEFKRQIEDLQERIQSGELKRRAEEDSRKLKEPPSQTETTPTK